MITWVDLKSFITVSSSLSLTMVVLVVHRCFHRDPNRMILQLPDHQHGLVLLDHLDRKNPWSRHHLAHQRRFVCLPRQYRIQSEQLSFQLPSRSSQYPIQPFRWWFWCRHRWLLSMRHQQSHTRFCSWRCQDCIRPYRGLSSILLLVLWSRLLLLRFEKVFP